jgi:hypothetical protein
VPDNPLSRLAEALRAEREGEPAADDGEEQAPEGKAPEGKPKDLAGLAALLKIEPAELYKVTVPSSREGAEPYTLGKLKDLAAEHDDFEVRSLQLEENDRKRQAEFLRAEQELQAIFASLPPEAIKPEARAKLEARRNKALADERPRVLKAIPEWENPDVRTLELEQMVEHLKEYGFPETYLSTVFDHRTLRYIRDNWRRAVQVQKALERVAERKPNTPPKSKPSNTKQGQRPPNGAVGPQSAFAQTILNANRS